MFRKKPAEVEVTPAKHRPPYDLKEVKVILPNGGITFMEYAPGAKTAFNNLDAGILQIEQVREFQIDRGGSFHLSDWTPRKP